MAMAWLRVRLSKGERGKVKGERGKDILENSNYDKVRRV